MGLLETGNGNTFIRFYNTLASAAQDISLPGGVTNNNYRPCFAWYQGKTYITNQYSTALLVTEDAGVAAVYKLGMTAPDATFTPALSAQGTGITGNCIGKLTFVQKIGTYTIAESAASAASNTIALVNQGRRWAPSGGGNWPANPDSTRITHVRLYVSVDGNDFMLAAEVAAASFFGVATYDENTATSALGQTIDDNLGFPSEAKTAKYCEVYHDRMWYAATSTNAYRIYFSEVGQPEAVGPLSWIDTRDGEHITGIKRFRDTLLIFTRRATYEIQGFGPSDFVFSKISQDVGCISHWSAVNIYERLWFAATDGIYVYDGGFKLITKDVKKFYKDDYKAHAVAYENSIAENDLYWNGYKLLVDRQSGDRGFYWFGNYSGFEPALGGGGDQPIWSFDLRNRNDTTLAKYYDNTNGEQLLTGSTDGYTRRENVSTNFNDDGDSYNMKLTIQTGHHLMDDPGGDFEEGKSFTRLWTYVQSENNAWTLFVYGGDEEASSASTASTGNVWQDNVAASAETRVIGGSTYTYVPMTVHWHVPGKGATGRGITLKITCSSPNDFHYRGFGGNFGRGALKRGWSSVV